MVKCNARLNSLQEIRQYVTKTLRQIDQLQPDSYHLTERIIVRMGRPCGLYFCHHGPSAVRLTAIWETDNDTILFYSSGGQRIRKTQLEDSPKLVPLGFRPTPEAVPA